CVPGVDAARRASRQRELRHLEAGDAEGERHRVDLGQPALLPQDRCDGRHGGVRNWALETQNPTAMTQRGWSRQAFKVGDQVTVVLEAVKNGASIGRIVSVMLPDGSTLSAGNLPNAPPPVQ